MRGGFDGNCRSSHLNPLPQGERKSQEQEIDGKIKDVVRISPLREKKSELRYSLEKKELEGI